MKKLDDDQKQFIGRLLRYTAEVLIIVAAFFGVTTLTASCGSLTKATIRQINPNATVKVSITTNNPSEITVNPNTELKNE